MLRARILLVVASVVLVFAIYQLPRVVVENDVVADAQQLEEPSELTEENPDGHSLEISEELEKRIASLQEKIDVEENPKNLINFADSLGRIYLSVNQLDSAYAYAQKIFEIDSEEYGQLKSGLLLYSVFELTNDQQKSAALGQRVRTLLEPIATSSGDLSLKIKIGMTYVSGQNPMKGILMIREVLDEDPQNVEALFKLGFLAVQSGQLEKAVERFEQILSIEPKDWNSVLYLGISLTELGQVTKAKKQFERIIEESNIPVLQQIARDYLKKIE
ncbi:MAG: tetratricopeptide repeat protein [Bacteroidota bacterium]